MWWRVGEVQRPGGGGGSRDGWDLSPLLAPRRWRGKRPLNFPEAWLLTCLLPLECRWVEEGEGFLIEGGASSNGCCRSCKGWTQCRPSAREKARVGPTSATV